MRADESGTVVGGPTRVADGEAAVAGRIDVKERVLVKVAQEASSAVIGVTRGDVSVAVADYRDGIVVRLSTPLPIPSLDDSAAIQAAVPVLERAAQLQDELRDRLTTLLGRDVVKINLTITGATIPERKRVR